MTKVVVNSPNFFFFFLAFVFNTNIVAQAINKIIIKIS